MTQQQLYPLIAVAVMIPLVLLRNRRPRTLRPRFMWVLPLLVVSLIGFGLWGITAQDPGHAPTDPLSLLILVVGLALGCAFGWQRGKMVTIFKEPNGTLKAQASPIGVIILVAILIARASLKDYLQAHAADWHVNPNAILEAFMLFAAGTVVTQRIEMWIRARNILRGGADAHVQLETRPDAAAGPARS